MLLRRYMYTWLYRLCYQIAKPILEVKLLFLNMSSKYGTSTLLFICLFLFFSQDLRERRWKRHAAVVESKARKGHRTAAVPECRWLRKDQTNYPRLNMTMCHQLWPTHWQLPFHTSPSSYPSPTHIGSHRSAISISSRVVMPGPRAHGGSWVDQERYNSIHAIYIYLL